MRWILVSMLAGCITVEMSSGEPWPVANGHIVTPDGTELKCHERRSSSDPHVVGSPYWKSVVKRGHECCEALGARLAFMTLDTAWPYCR